MKSFQYITCIAKFVLPPSSWPRNGRHGFVHRCSPLSLLSLTGTSLPGTMVLRQLCQDFKMYMYPILYQSHQAFCIEKWCTNIIYLLRWNLFFCWVFWVELKMESCGTWRDSLGKRGRKLEIHKIYLCPILSIIAITTDSLTF